MRRVSLKILALLMAGSIFASSGNAASEILVKPGERLIFFGDSITWMGLYTIPLTSYLTLRYPELPFDSLLNAGVPGNTANDGLKRLQSDVLDQKPTLVTVSFGINDCRFAPRGTNTCPVFFAAMNEIVTKLKAAGVRVLVLSPGCVDPDGTGNKLWYKTPEDCQAANATLERMTEGLKNLAASNDVLFCDLFHPMLAVQTQLKADQPGFTMIADGLHPDDFGACIMAATILKSLGVDRPASSAAIDIARGTTVTDHCRIAALQVSSNLVSFSRTDELLPIAVVNLRNQKSAMTALARFPEWKNWNSYGLCVRGLAAGKWHVSASGTEDVGVFSAEELAAGVDLAPHNGPWLFFAEQVNKFEISLLGRRRVVAERGRDFVNWVPGSLMPDAVALRTKIEATFDLEARHRGDVMQAVPAWQWKLKRLENK